MRIILKESCSCYCIETELLIGMSQPLLFNIPLVAAQILIDDKKEDGVRGIESIRAILRLG